MLVDPVMNAVVEHGTPLVDDPGRVGPGCRQLGVDETSFLKATRSHPTIYATGLVDLGRHVLIDMVKGRQRQGSAGLDGARSTPPG